MLRPQKEAYGLSDAEKRDLIQLIQQDKPLPEQYRFVLFEDKREVELVWNGKSREVCTLPSYPSSRWSTWTSRARKRRNRRSSISSISAAASSRAGPTSSSGATTS